MWDLWKILEQIFSQSFGFPCQISFHPLLITHISSVARTIVADIPSRLSLTNPKKLNRKNYLKVFVLLNIISIL
jgi:hypothetical protein